MMGKTHIAVGIAASYLIIQPKTVPEIITATVGGCIGGVMADIDVKIDNSNRFARKASMDAVYGELLALALSATLLSADYFYGGQIMQTIINHWQRSAAGAVLFIILCILGKKSDHRDRTHSLLALVLFTASVLLIDTSIGIAFGIGYASHLLIDIFNKSPIRLFYPLKKGICTKICYADRLGNELFLIFGVCIIAFYLFFISNLR